MSGRRVAARVAVAMAAAEADAGDATNAVAIDPMTARAPAAARPAEAAR